ncbi:MAG: hypothetical protein J5677_01890 [Bacteroidales bacterium]|nr:hypothetical protein [Bacteroidales bacterium]
MKYQQVIEAPEQMMVENLLEIGQWRQAFPLAKKAMEQSLAKMQEYYIDTYDIYEKHRSNDPETDPTAGGWFDSYTDANAGLFLPAIKNLLRLFDMAINDIDRCHAASNYEDELEEIKQIIDKMVHDAKVPFEDN